MSLRPLIITETTRANIKAAREKALTRITPWETLRKYAMTKPALKLEDRPPGAEEISGRSENVLIARGYRAAISFEEQPAGIIRHLSVSVDKPGKLPSPQAVDAIAALFGFNIPVAGRSTVWLEEFAPGHQAVNVAQLERERQAGHA